MADAGDLKFRQVEVADLVPSLTPVLRPAISVTAAAFSLARSAAAAGGRLTVILVPAGWIGWPAVPVAGKVAVIWALTGCGPEGNTHT
jgi:hypothetical protein